MSFAGCEDVGGKRWNTSKQGPFGHSGVNRITVKTEIFDDHVFYVFVGPQFVEEISINSRLVGPATVVHS